MRTFLFILCTSCMMANSEPTAEKITDSTVYGSFSLGPVPFPIPGFGIGYKTQTDHLGYDIRGQINTVGVGSQAKFQALGLYYFTPQLKSQFYTGLGLSTSALFGQIKVKNSEFIGSPEWVFGKSYLNENNEKRFFELQVSFPTFSKEGGMYFPLCQFTYGIGF